MRRFVIRYILFFGFSLSAVAQSVKIKDDSLLAQMTSAIEQGQYPKVHSISVFKGDKPVYEHFFNGFNPDSLHDSRSSFKSITSLLVGIAIDRGLIKDVNQKVYEFFPQYPDFGKDKLKKEMTLRNLLEMKSGFDCEEFNDTKDCEEEMSLSKDWVKFSLGLPMKYKPGEVWSYTSIDPMILSGVISKASGMTIMKFAEQYLFKPMGIIDYRWTVDPAGHGMTGGSFYIHPSDMVKLGRLVKDNGVWKGKQLISKRWISQSALCDIPIPDFSNAKSSRSSLLIPQPTFYGFYWYREVLKTKDIQQDLLFASGNGGQFIFILKDLDLTVVFTQGNYQSFKGKQAFEILAKYIVPGFSGK
ncbi:serine hydrolase domain-containing protein [Pedobacter cryoconitis]|uniref:CubicO group peptidase (Beta-lactamase class C family) n=1 Tax=Pedobacter cryoconitis TaxID=188932 RepID=A0A327SY91_9SPHI|nr:serine hydrolase [Pedobacter cryoconitis]RAJ34360.1 CubicO group peptidase (beta-lactamase class C family) [Pedobacter cryoconitis]